MTYIFTGILSNEDLPENITYDTEQLVFRKISHPNVCSGVLFPEQAEEQVIKPNRETLKLINASGLNGITEGVWVYYMCWGGDLEVVALAKVKNSKFEENSYEIFEDVGYHDLQKIFGKYGINFDANGHFDPFVRNFWGINGY